MKTTLVSLAIAAAFVACNNSSKLQRKDQQQYDVVQEGQASGVTSTINAPGEVAPPPAPMTGTNADTTSNFTLPQVSTGGTAGTQPGTIAQSLPQNTGSMNVGYPTTTAAPPRPRTATATPPTTQPRRSTPPRTDTTYTVESAPPPSSTVEPNTDTAPPPPPSTDTTSTKKQKDKDNSQQPPAQTNTQPPPTTTT